LEVEKIRDIFPHGNLKVEGNILRVLYPYEYALSEETWENNAKIALCEILKNTEEIRIMFDPRASMLVLKIGFEISGENIQYIRKIKPTTNREYEEMSAKTREDFWNNPQENTELLEAFWRHFNGVDFEDEDEVLEHGAEWLDEIIKREASNITGLASLERWKKLKEMSRIFHQYIPRYELEFCESDGDYSFIEFDLFEEKNKINTTIKGKSLTVFVEMIELSDYISFEFCSQGIMINFGVNLSK